jgi:hypothetical protein
MRSKHTFYLQQFFFSENRDVYDIMLKKHKIHDWVSTATMVTRTDHNIAYTSYLVSYKSAQCNVSAFIKGLYPQHASELHSLVPTVTSSTLLQWSAVPSATANNILPLRVV